ncbi:MAG: hypothetical protein H0W76_08370 [Pyrinomonadaceae bacterium]|nr:hypothetical protein [Pyrinomonadaceae bacterium]
MTTKKKEVEPEGPPPNIKFVGKDFEQYGKTIPAEALRKINHGERTLMLPGEGQKANTEAQAKGFYHEDAVEIVRLYPAQYKLLTEKGN